MKTISIIVVVFLFGFFGWFGYKNEPDPKKIAIIKKTEEKIIRAENYGSKLEMKIQTKQNEIKQQQK